MEAGTLFFEIFGPEGRQAFSRPPAFAHALAEAKGGGQPFRVATQPSCPVDFDSERRLAYVCSGYCFTSCPHPFSRCLIVWCMGLNLILTANVYQCLGCVAQIGGRTLVGPEGRCAARLRPRLSRSQRRRPTL